MQNIPKIIQGFEIVVLTSILVFGLLVFSGKDLAVTEFVKVLDNLIIGYTGYAAKSAINSKNVIKNE